MVLGFMPVRTDFAHQQSWVTDNRALCYLASSVCFQSKNSLKSLLKGSRLRHKQLFSAHFVLTKD